MEKRRFIIGFIFMVLGILLIMGGPKKAKAEIRITDCFSVTGFLRYEMAVHTGGRNPNNTLQDDNNDLNFARTYLQTEWTYQPSDKFKLFSKIRLTGDHTEDFDSEVGSFDAFPVNVAEYHWTLMEGSEDDFRAEVWELYADVSIGKLWLRLGKQQIAWGEMIATRLMDVINPLDFSRNMLFEPEEFENIRIPNWAIRGRYRFGNLGKVVRDFVLEGFVNPGDVLPTQHADFGSPLYLGVDLKRVFPPFFRLTDKDRRGDTEFGFRLGGMIGSFYLTLNYLYLYSDDFFLDLRGLAFPPFALLIDMEYPSVDIYGLTCNYFIAPLNTVATFEGTWVPNQPYQDPGAPLGFGIKDQGTWSYAIRFDRPTQVFSPTFFHANFMMIQLQFNQTVREGDHNRILGSGTSKVDRTDEIIALVLNQLFHYNDYGITLMVVYDWDDATYFKPSFKYTHGTNWYFDLYGVFLSGSEKRPGRFGGIDWVNQVVGRVTYQF